jgi:hypothetical protein
MQRQALSLQCFQGMLLVEAVPLYFLLFFQLKAAKQQQDMRIGNGHHRNYWRHRE